MCGYGCEGVLDCLCVNVGIGIGVGVDGVVDGGVHVHVRVVVNKVEGIGVVMAVGVHQGLVWVWVSGQVYVSVV